MCRDNDTTATGFAGRKRAMTMTSTATKFHRDGTVTLWSVQCQSWQRLSHVSAETLASLPAQERRRVMSHLVEAQSEWEYRNG